jgi:SAM-dependent methyltransferase
VAVDEVVKARAGSRNPFDRSGLASLDDLESPYWRETFCRLEEFQRQFLSRQQEFISPEYKWPVDTLHEWSRVWEYPYVYFHLKAWLERRTPTDALPRVLDFGSGVTFFPFVLAAEGLWVEAVDVDPVVERDLGRAIELMPCSPGRVSFTRCSQDHIPLEDASVDAAFSISVLEHVSDPGRAVLEVARVLAPGGLFVVTMDVCVEGWLQLKPGPFRRLMNLLEERFEWMAPQETVHPSRVLDTRSSPYVPDGSSSRSYPFLRFVKRQLRRLLGPRIIPQNRLCSMGLALRKPADLRPADWCG